MSQTPDREELSKLILAHLDGEIGDAEFDGLQKHLHNSVDARQRYVQMARLDSALREKAEADIPPIQDSLVPLPEQTSAFSRRMLAMAAGFAILGVLGGWLLKQATTTASDDDPSANFSATGSEAASNGVAVVTEMVDVVWAANSTETREGQAIPPGPLSLESGLAQIEFFSGASITIEGPASIEIVNRDRAIVHHGQLKADVPPAARGFSLIAGEVELIDWGTTFGVSVSPGASTETNLIVFDGEVISRDREGHEISITGGQSQRFASGKATGESASSKDAFRDIDDVLSQTADRHRTRYLRWQESSRELQNDPRLLLYYDFENLPPSSRRLPNVANGNNSEGPEFDGGIVGAQSSTGRWPQKRALDFRRASDRVRVEIPGEFDALTLFAWVRIDALDRNLNSLFLADFYDPGDIHWQISSRGTLNFSSSPNGAEDLDNFNRRYFSEPFWSPAQSGRWFFLATVADHTNNRVQHYVNGKPLDISDGLNLDKPLAKMRIGSADIGNWTDPISPDWGLRTLNGRIDEFGIFRAALTDREIHELFKNGKP